MPKLEIKLKDQDQDISDFERIPEINQAVNKINTDLTGLICTTHILRPIAQKTFYDEQWFIEVRTCCLPLLLEVKRRLEQ